MLRAVAIVFAVTLAGCTEIEVDRTSPSAWYYERYAHTRDRIVHLPSGPARVLVFDNVHFVIPFMMKMARSTGMRMDGLPR